MITKESQEPQEFSTRTYDQDRLSKNSKSN